MEIIGYMILGLLIIAAIVYLLHLFRLAIIVIACISSAYLFFFKDSWLGACVVMGAWYVIDCIVQRLGHSFKESNGNTTSSKSTKKVASVSSYNRNITKSGSSRVNWNFILMCVIPLFWPYLIFRVFFRDKPVNELTANDYEHHLRCNGK